MHELIDRGEEPSNSDIVRNKQTKKETMGWHENKSFWSAEDTSEVETYIVGKTVTSYTFDIRSVIRTHKDLRITTIHL